MLDHVQFSERGYQHRNRILGHAGQHRWLTVPVCRRFGQRLTDVRIADPRWARKHWRTLAQNYGKAPSWAALRRLSGLFTQPWTHLVELDLALTRMLLDMLGMNVELVRYSGLAPHGARTAMLIGLCEPTGHHALRVGTGALRDLDSAALQTAGIAVEVATYTHPPYPQRHYGPFVPALSVLDLLLQRGPTARDVLMTGSAISPWDATP